MADDLEDLTKQELQDRADDNDLATSGSKSELIERLRDHDGDSSDRSSSGGGSSSSGGARDAIDIARRELSDTIGADIESITGARRDGDSGDWVVEVQTVEARRIPPSNDIVALFRVTVSGDEMAGFDRIQRGRRDSLDIS